MQWAGHPPCNQPSVDYVYIYAEVHGSILLTFMQAGRKGASVFVTGIIIGITPMAVTVLAPVVGYLVLEAYNLLIIT